MVILFSKAWVKDRLKKGYQSLSTFSYILISWSNFVPKRIWIKLVETSLNINNAKQCGLHHLSQSIPTISFFLSFFFFSCTTTNLTVFWPRSYYSLRLTLEFQSMSTGHHLDQVQTSTVQLFLGRWTHWNKDNCASRSSILFVYCILAPGESAAMNAHIFL